MGTRKLYWGRLWCRTDFGGAWKRAKVRPRWWWFLRAAWRFPRWWGMLRREYRTLYGNRAAIVVAGTAWYLASTRNGLTGPCPVEAGPPPVWENDIVIGE